MSSTPPVARCERRSSVWCGASSAHRRARVIASEPSARSVRARTVSSHHPWGRGETRSERLPPLSRSLARSLDRSPDPRVFSRATRVPCRGALPRQWNATNLGPDTDPDTWRILDGKLYLFMYVVALRRARFGGRGGGPHKRAAAASTAGAGVTTPFPGGAAACADALPLPRV